MRGYYFTFAYQTQGGTAGDESRDSHLELRKGEGNVFRSEEWLTWDRLTLVGGQSGKET